LAVAKYNSNYSIIRQAKIIISTLSTLLYFQPTRPNKT